MFANMDNLKRDLEQQLQAIGLSPQEAQIYSALVRHGSLGASAIAKLINVPRSSVYPALDALTDKGLLEAEAGYGSRFSAVPPSDALPSLLAREQETLQQRQAIAGEVIAGFAAVAEPVEALADNLIQVIRNPRAASERFDRLHLEARRQIEGFIKAPFLMRPSDLPVQQRALQRGVRIRGIYEQAVLDEPEVKPFLAKWVSAGEEARVFAGSLPHKLALFDRESVLLPLFMPGDQVRTLFIRHPQLAISLGMLFDSLWERSTPIEPEVSTLRRRMRRKSRQENKDGARRGKSEVSTSDGLDGQPAR